MTSTTLTSDHVNYLVWRYLQESGYGDAAVKLERDWKEDPQGLPFAQFIRTHALVSLVQKGLQYHEIEQSLDQHGRPIPPSEAVLFFGPGSGQLTSPTVPALTDTATGPSPLATTATAGVSNGNAIEDGGYGGDKSPRKHARDARTNGETTSQPPPKRSRRSNGVENGEAMDLDEPVAADLNGRHAHGDQGVPEAPPSPAAAAAAGAPSLRAATPPRNATPSPPADAEQPAPQAPTTSALGASVATQVEKLAELGPDTAFLDLEHDRRGSVMHCAWNPADPQSLLVAGSSALCRIWALRSTANAATSPPQRVDLDAGDGLGSAPWMATAAVWSPDGRHVAVGLCDAEHVYSGQVAVWTKQGGLVEVLPVGPHAVLSLRWSPAGAALLAVCAGVAGSNVMLWNPMTADPLDCVRVDAPLEDAAWLGESDLVVAGADALRAYRLDGRGAALVHAYEAPAHRDLWLVRHDASTDVVATCSHGGVVEFWDRLERLHSFEAHAEQMTAMEFQPLANPRSAGNEADSPRLLATSSLDGTIRVWNAKRPYGCLHTLDLGATNPVMALAFSPDGFAVAGASFGKILVWNAGEGGVPKAVWNGKMLRESLGNGTNGEVGDSETDVDQHSLAWDADGGKLAYSVGRQVSL
ncbi:MAG: hypothetical protein M1832_000428 [Thelocarpon impressellum]|nr:MAG: hypothetical protein M1832_000428 [Thelocarpon impressellum]